MTGFILNLLEKVYLGLARPLGRQARARVMLETPLVMNPLRVEPPPGRVLVLAPHPDDEAIGCGGTILKMAGRAEATVALFTDGGLGRPDWSPQQTLKVRRAEMERGARTLGLSFDRIVYLGGREQSLIEDRTVLIDRLRELFEKTRPEAIFLPFYMDAHIDHRHANRLFLEASEGCLAPRTPVWAYEVWSPCPANVAVDISPVAEAKAAAIAEHGSQDSLMRYSTAALGLNAFRAMQINWEAAPGLTHAEAFWRTALAEYRERALPWLTRADAKDER